MGICLHAIIEFRVDRAALEGETADADGRRVYWEDVAKVDLNKNYSFMSSLHEDPRVLRGWPKDASIDRELREERCIDQGLSWCDLPTLADLVETGPSKLDEDEPRGPYRGQPAAILAFMRSFELEDVRTRVMFYES